MVHACCTRIERLELRLRPRRTITNKAMKERRERVVHKEEENGCIVKPSACLCKILRAHLRFKRQIIKQSIMPLEHSLEVALN